MTNTSGRTTGTNGSFDRPEDRMGSGNRSLRDNIAEEGANYANKAADAAHGMAERARAGAGQAAGALKDTAEQQKSGAADAVAGLAHRASEAASSLEDTSPQIANVIRRTAGAVEGAALDIRDKDMGELMDAVVEFGRRRPMTMLAVGVIGGVLLGRIMGGSDRRA